MQPTEIAASEDATHNKNRRKVMRAISSKRAAIVKRIAQIVDKLSSAILSVGNIVNNAGAVFGTRTNEKPWQLEKSLDTPGLNIKVRCHAVIRAFAWPSGGFWGNERRLIWASAKQITPHDSKRPIQVAQQT
ncbi:MAG: hypothetical protein OSB55_15235 [Verrucomicrobiota bacterium]|nr:hypothetical protein [Verrucomicrobiota bacterium]